MIRYLQGLAIQAFDSFDAVALDCKSWSSDHHLYTCLMNWTHWILMNSLKFMNFQAYYVQRHHSHLSDWNSLDISITRQHILIGLGFFLRGLWGLLEDECCYLITISNDLLINQENSGFGNNATLNSKNQQD